MSVYLFRLRRTTLSLSSIFLNKPISSLSSAPPLTPFNLTPIIPPAVSQFRAFRASTISLARIRNAYQNDNDDFKIGPDDILFEGCDYNHWLITIDFPKEPRPSSEEKVETYVKTAAMIFGSVEEAKKKIYACSTTTYDGFQVECSEETSKKFEGLPGVVFVLPDSYIDPVNKQYGGDKYDNGIITPRPPPTQYGRTGGRFGDRNRDFNRPMRPRGEFNQGNPAYDNRGNTQGSAGNFRPSRQPPPQQNYGTPRVAPVNNSSGGYATGWDQTSAARTQQTTQAGGYDYYGQQSAPQQQSPGGAPGSADNTGYGYQQQAAAGYSQQGQGYSQDAYGAYHASAPQSGYGQPQSGYNQQQGYGSTPGYGNVANPITEGQNASYKAQGDSNSAPPSTAVGQLGYNSSQQPSPNPSYPPPAQPGYGAPPNSQTGYGTQPSAGYRPSYGAPQAQKPASGQPAYGQPQQSPTSQGGYAQPAPVQPGYSHSQPPSGYGAAPASGYAAAPPSYGAAPPATQPSYGGQQPPYNSSYASGYSQPPAYSADGNAAPASQTLPPNAAAKASPQS